MDLKKTLHIKSMDDGVNALKEAGGLLVDVRSVEEFNEGHIPGSVNIPVNDIHEIKNHVKSKNDLIGVYCESGIRANKAQTILHAHEYRNVRNLGKIRDYKGAIEK